jgi:hypothetical protein
MSSYEHLNLKFSGHTGIFQNKKNLTLFEALFFDCLSMMIRLPEMPFTRRVHGISGF